MNVGGPGTPPELSRWEEGGAVAVGAGESRASRARGRTGESAAAGRSSTSGGEAR